MKVDIGIKIEVERLIETRLLIQSNSGGGKSYTIRKILEETNGKVQQIVLDLEGEFASLREKFDFIVFGNDADYPIHIKYADRTARTLLELNVSAIIDLYELKHHERITFVKRFLEAMINAPKQLWHPCLVVVDEAHIFCPEKGSAESSSSVIDLCTRGRKRGYCAVLATQRLSKLHKDAAAECNNKLIGRTGLDVDMKRAGDELGFTNKQDFLSLRNLEAGSFFAFGPAISNEITQFKVSAVKTSHPKTGARLTVIPPATEKIKRALSKIKDLPQEAEKELNSLQDMKAEIKSLRLQLTQAKKNPKGISSDELIKLQSEKNELIRRGKELQSNLDKGLNQFKRQYESVITKHKLIFKNIAAQLSKIDDADIQIKIPEIKNSIPPAATIKPIERLARNNNSNSFESSSEKITGGAMRMLKAAAKFYPNSITKMRMAAIAGMSYRSGSFGTYLATLKRNGLIEGYGSDFKVTESGYNEAGDIDPLPSDAESLISMWCTIIKGGAARMFQALADAYPSTLTKEELGASVGFSHTSGTFGTYMATLKRNGLITVNGSSIKAADELFN